MRCRVRYDNATQAALGHPYGVTPRLQRRGIKAGLDDFGREILLDPWTAKSGRVPGIEEVEKILRSMIFLVIGNKDSGKSTLLKSLVIMFMCLQAQMGQRMRVRIHDRKPEKGAPEWALIAQALGCEWVELGKMMLNVFDPVLVRDVTAMLRMANNVAELVKRGRLTGLQPLALQMAVYTMMQKFSSIAAPDTLAGVLLKLDQDDYESYFKHTRAALFKNHRKELLSDLNMKAELKLVMDRPNNNVDVRELQNAAGEVAALFLQVIDSTGIHGPLFSGKESISHYFSMRALLMDWSGIEGETRTMLQTVFYGLEASAMQANLKDMIPHVYVAEEEHEGMAELPTLRAKAWKNAKARAFPTADFSTTQFTNGMRIGDAGSDIREVADRIAQGTDVLMAGSLPFNVQTLTDLKEWGFSERHAREIINHPTGTFGVKVRNQRYPAFNLQHIVPGPVLPLVQTNSAAEEMSDRVSQWDDAEVLARMEQAGFDFRVLQPGVPL